MRYWFGSVPSGWKAIKLKFLCKQNLEKTSSKSNYVGLENIESNTSTYIASNIVPSGENIKFSKGDILFGKLRPYLAKVWRAEFDGCCSSEFFVLTAKEINPDYLKLVLISPSFIELVNGSTFGAKMPRSNWEFVGDQFIPVPPLEMQRCIAYFVAKSTLNIDALSKISQSKLELLSSYRQSLITRAVTKGLDPNANVDCMKNVPFKRFIISRNGGMWGSEPGSAEVDALCIRVADFDYANLKTRPTASTMRSISEKQLQNNQLRDGDILLEKSGGGEKTPVGRAVYYSGCEGAICSNFIERLTINRQMLNPKFACYVLSSAYSQRKNFDCIKQTTGIQNLSVDDYLSSVTVPLFDLETQQRITNWLDKQLSKVAQVITANQAHLMKLTAYRQSLISYAVTGQLAIEEAEE